MCCLVRCQKSNLISSGITRSVAFHEIGTWQIIVLNLVVQFDPSFLSDFSACNGRKGGWNRERQIKIEKERKEGRKGEKEWLASAALSQVHPFTQHETEEMENQILLKRKSCDTKLAVCLKSIDLFEKRIAAVLFRAF